MVVIRRWFAALIVIGLVIAALPAAAQSTAPCEGSGVGLMGDREYAAAVNYFACVIENFPDDPDAHLNLIWATLMTGRYADAVNLLVALRAAVTGQDPSEYLSAAAARLASAPDESEQTLRALLLWATADDTAALAVYDQLTASDQPVIVEFADAFRWSSQLYLGEVTSAEVVSAAADFASTNPQFYAVVAEALRFNSDPDDFADFTALAIERFPDDPLLLINRLRALYLNNGADDEVSPIVEALLAIEPGTVDSNFFVDLSQLFADMGMVALTEQAVASGVAAGEAQDRFLYTLMQANENAGDAAAAARYALDYLNANRTVTTRRTLASLTQPNTIQMRTGLVYEITIELPETNIYTFSVSSVIPGEVDPFIVLLDADGTPIASNDDVDAGASNYDSLIDTLTTGGLPAGTYTLVVGYAGLGSVGELSLMIGRG